MGRRLTTAILVGVQKGRCFYCEEPFGPYPMAPTIDHVHPLAAGGEDGWDNWVAACHPCNSFKAHRTDIGAGDLRGAWTADLIRRMAAHHTVRLVPAGWKVDPVTKRATPPAGHLTGPPRPLRTLTPHPDTEPWLEAAVAAGWTVGVSKRSQDGKPGLRATAPDGTVIGVPSVGADVAAEVGSFAKQMAHRLTPVVPCTTVSDGNQPPTERPVPCQEP
jgi:hypothetical protein